MNGRDAGLLIGALLLLAVWEFILLIVLTALAVLVGIVAFHAVRAVVSWHAERAACPGCGGEPVSLTVHPELLCWGHRKLLERIERLEEETLGV